jgi:hypothetical protein
MGLNTQIRRLTNCNTARKPAALRGSRQNRSSSPHFSKILNITHYISGLPWIHFVDPQHQRHHDQQGRPVLGLLFQEVAVAGLRIGPRPFSAQVSNVLQSQDRSASSLTVRFTCLKTATEDICTTEKKRSLRDPAITTGADIGALLKRDCGFLSGIGTEERSRYEQTISGQILKWLWLRWKHLRDKPTSEHVSEEEPLKATSLPWL